jgi:hypothetical protein
MKTDNTVYGQRVLINHQIVYSLTLKVMVSKLRQRLAHEVTTKGCRAVLFVHSNPQYMRMPCHAMPMQLAGLDSTIVPQPPPYTKPGSPPLNQSLQIDNIYFREIRWISPIDHICRSIQARPYITDPNILPRQLPCPLDLIIRNPNIISRNPNCWSPRS